MVIRVSHIPEHLAAEAQARAEGTIGADTSHLSSPLSKVHEGTFRMGMRDEEATAAGVTRHVVSTDGVRGGNVLGTLQRSGKPSVELEPGNASSRTSVETAIRLGVLERDAQGTLREVAQSVQQQQQQSAPQAQSAATPEQSDFSHPEEDRAFASDMKDIHEHVFDAARARVGHAVVMGSSLDAAAKALALDTNTDHAQAAETIQNGVWYFEQIANRAARAAGLGEHQLGDFRAHLESNPHEFMQIVQGLTYGRDVSRLQASAKAWLTKQG